MTHPTDPVNSKPIPPLVDSYTYHSELPDSIASTSASNNTDHGWIMGIDEAGRGPVLGPMVYAAAYCPLSFKAELEEMGFDDSKALKDDVRQHLWESFETHPELCYSSATLSPQAISANMLRKIPINLNRQAEEATVDLIRSALARNVPITQCFVDALGPAPQWQARLSQIFPTIAFTVCPKADSLFKIVGAASIIAKVTRDRYIEGWVDIEDSRSAENESRKTEEVGGKKRKREAGGETEEENQEEVARGSGYPSDPRTQAFLKDSLDPIFGYKGVVRFSWATVKVLLDKQGVDCRWIDDATQPSAASYFSAEADNSRPKIWRDLGMGGVGEL